MSRAARVMPSPDVTQPHLAPPSRHIFPTQVYYTGYDQVHHAYLVLVPDAAPGIASKSIANPCVSVDNSDTDVRRSDVSGNIGNASDNAVRQTHVTESQVDYPDCPKDKTMNTKDTCEVLDKAERCITEGTNVANPEFRLSVVIPEEGGEFVWL